MSTMKKEPLLRIEDLHISFHTYAGVVQAVRGVDLELEAGSVLAIVGESGCGKSVTAQSVLQLNPAPPAVVDGGRILMEGRDLLTLTDKQMQQVRGHEISMIFQDPMTSLNPTMRIGRQIIEGVLRHQQVSKQEAARQAVDMLRMVGISNSEVRMRQYPHELSGGMRQRVMIAMALVCKPKILIADEPTTALDVTIQTQIVDLLLDMRERLGTAIMLITHDMGVVADIADRVAVMYAGLIVEQGSVRDLFYDPHHPYTWGLLNSLPKMNDASAELIPIEGTPPDLLNPPPGCPFAPRCRYCMRICHAAAPDQTFVSEDHFVRCWLKHEYAPVIRRESGVACE